MSGPVVTEVSRGRLARDALRFGFLGAMLLYTFLPVLVGAREDTLHLRAVWPGAWAGALAGLACVLGGILYSAGPSWRSTLQPPHALVGAQFYASALGSIAVFGALMMASTGRDAPAHVRGPLGTLETAGGALFLTSAVLFVLNAALAIRSHRRVRSGAGT